MPQLSKSSLCNHMGPQLHVDKLQLRVHMVIDTPESSHNRNDVSEG